MSLLHPNRCTVVHKPRGDERFNYLEGATHIGTRITMRGERDNANCRKKSTRLKTLNRTKGETDLLKERDRE